MHIRWNYLAEMQIETQGGCGGGKATGSDYGIRPPPDKTKSLGSWSLSGTIS